MSETLGSMTDEDGARQLAERLLAQAKEQGVDLVGPDGLLNRLTKNVLETALEAEMTEHLGCDKHDPAGRARANSRNGTRSKTVLTEIDPVEIEVPRDTKSTFDPQIVRKRQRRLTGVDEIVLSLTAKGPTTGEIVAHFDDVYGAAITPPSRRRTAAAVGSRRPRRPGGPAGPGSLVLAALGSGGPIRAHSGRVARARRARRLGGRARRRPARRGPGADPRPRNHFPLLSAGQYLASGSPRSSR